jgi:6-phosphogluconolactonase
MTAAQVTVVRDRPLLLDAVAARLITRVVDHQAASGSSTVLLGGDALVGAVLARVATTPARDAVDWGRLDLWWADDAWAEADAPTRAATMSAALLDVVDVDDRRVHWMPHRSADGDTAEAAAAAYARLLAEARQPDDHGPTPTFDIAVLGLAADGGIAGVRPEHPVVHDPRSVGVDRGHGRLTMTLAGLAGSREAWLLGSGPECASAAVLALSGAGALQVPAAGVHGQQRTLFLLDDAAAAQLPASLRRIASP